MSKVGDKFIFEVTRTGLCSDNTNELVCGEAYYYVAEKRIAGLKKYQAWIPINERLPEVDKYGDVNVLVCMDDEFVATATYDKNNGWELWAESGEVIAWMPLPEPYKPHETKLEVNSNGD